MFEALTKTFPGIFPELVPNFDPKFKMPIESHPRTITERDVKHLERHLSMKKTIRKKMMRDLQQAFVDDPTKFTKSEAVANDSKDIIEAFDFDPRSTKRERDENRFLEILRGNEGSEDSGHGSPPPSAGEDANPAADRTQKVHKKKDFT